jgi:hypothetical protein
MLQFMLLLVLLDFIVKIPDFKRVHELHKLGWKGNIHEYYEWKRK